MILGATLPWKTARGASIAIPWRAKLRRPAPKSRQGRASWKTAYTLILTIVVHWDQKETIRQTHPRV